MNKINVTERGVLPDGASITAALTELIASVSEDTELYFPEGSYYFESVVAVQNKKRLTLRGDGARLILHFSPTDDPARNSNAFRFIDCEDIVIRDFVCSTDNPISCAGRVIAKDEAAGTYDVRIADEFPVTGLEHLAATNSCDEEGTPDYALATYEANRPITLEDGSVRYVGASYTVIGDHTIRVRVNPPVTLSRLTVGQRILYRYIIYGNSVFNFASCRNVTLTRIEIERCASFGATVSPRSANFTFEEFNMRMPEGTEALYAANADGIHILGLEGYLHMKNCKFNGLGDDALNIHGKAGEILSYNRETGEMKITCRNRQMQEIPVGKLWAQAGDIICVYDRDTFLLRGKLLLEDFNDGIAHAKLISGEADVGNILANDAFFASVHLEGCEFSNTRARGILLQSRNMLIENCRFYGLSLPGIIIAPDVRVWYEVGPSDNTEIRGCTFEKCAYIKSGANFGAIVVKSCHDAGAADYPAGVHTNIHIHDNVFRNCNSSAVYVSSTKGVRVENNRFEACRQTQESLPTTAYDVVTKNCEDVVIGSNASDKPAEFLSISE